MPKIIDGDDLIVGTEITIDTAARTFTLNATGNLVAKDGVTMQALYSKFIKLWETSAYNQFPFPMYAIDAKSGQFEFGFDGTRYNDWKPANDATRNMLRDGGWNEYQAGGTPDIAGTSATGDLARRYVGIVSLGELTTGTQAYYQLTSTAAPVNFVYDDEPNQAVQIFGDATVDATTTTFNTQTFFKAFAREEQKIFDDSVLADTGQTGTGAFVVNVLLSNETDLNVLDDDATITTPGSDYGDDEATGITVSYYNVSQSIDINAPTDNFDFRIIVEGNGKTLQQIYTKVQWLLRQNLDINQAVTNSLGAVTGKTADSLMRFEGSTLKCSQGVFIQNFDATQLNDVEFIDQGGTPRSYKFAAVLTLNFNSFLTQGGTGYFAVYITDSVVGTDDYGTSSAIILQDNAATPADIAGTITGASLTFLIDYDNNTQGGRSDFSAATGKIPITVVAGNKGVAKPVVATITAPNAGLLARSKTNSVTLTAEQDRAYTP